MTLRQQLTELGRERGRNAASWVESEDLWAIHQAFENGDPLILDALPSPLSGEFAGEPTPRSLAEEFGAEEGLTEEQLCIYEDAFHEAFAELIEKRAKAVLPNA